MLINRKPKMLNIIYFIDSNKTRTIRIPLLWVTICFVLLLLSFCWIAISIILIRNDLKYQRYLSQKIQQNLTNILQYQITYENIFENAYNPTFVTQIEQKQNPTLTQPLNEKESSQATQTSANPQISFNQQKQQTLANNKQENITKTNNEEDQEIIDEETSDKLSSEELKTIHKVPESLVKTNNNIEIQAEIQNIGYFYSDSNLVVSFIIKNVQENSKSEGYIWGSATYVTKDRGIININTPENLKYDDNGNILNPETTYRYSIKYFKHKKIEFKKPKLEGYFKEVKIGILDKNRNSIKYYSILIDSITKNDTQ